MATIAHEGANSAGEQVQSGLRTKVRELALYASIDERWAEAVPQNVHVTRQADLPDFESLSLMTEFDARRVKVGSGALRTFYLLTVTMIQDDMVKQELPDTVRRELEKMNAKNPDAPAPMIIDMGLDQDTVDQLLEEDETEDEDVRYRFERSVQYRLDGSANPLSVERSERYVMVEDDDEELSSVYSHQLVDLTKEEAPILNLSAWSELTAEAPACTIDGICTPEPEADTLKTDVEFLEIVNGYARDPELKKATREEAIQASLAIISFMQYQGRTAEVRKLL